MKIRIAAYLATFLLIAAAAGCSFSTANMSSMKVSKDKDGKQETTSFKSGDTIYAAATISNSMSKVTVKYQLVAEDVPGMKKGDLVKGSEVKIDLQSSGVAAYSLPIPAGAPSGKFTLVADMINEQGERKDGKSSPITIEGSSAPAAPPAAAADDKKGDDKMSDDKDAGKDDEKGTESKDDK